MITCTFENGNKANLRHTVVDAILIQDGKILLVQRAERLTEGGKWAFPAGYMDRDETATDAVKREIYEETGWQATDLQLFMIKDSPTRRNDERQNISLVFIATATEQTGTPDDESTDVRWFPLDALPAADQVAFDHLEIIEAYKSYRAAPVPIPFLA